MIHTIIFSILVGSFVSLQGMVETKREAAASHEKLRIVAVYDDKGLVERTVVDLSQGVSEIKILADKEKQLFDAILSNPTMVEVEALLKAGVNVNTRDSRGDTPLFLAINAGESHIAAKLIGAGADVNQAVTGGITPLMIAATRGDKLSIGALLAKQAEVNAQDDNGDTALMRVARRLDMQDKDGNTALMRAAKNGNWDIISLLLTHGAYGYTDNKAGENPHTVLLAVDPEYRKFLDFNDAIIRGWERDFKKHLEQDISMHIVDLHNDNGLLLSATYYHYIDLIQTFLERGADVNMQTKSGNMPLISSLVQYKLKDKELGLEMAKIFIKAGADVVRGNKFGERPLKTLDKYYTGNEEGYAQVKAMLEEAEAIQLAVKKKSGVSVSSAMGLA